ncbi:MAG: DUF4145 domain-containing protein [Ignavibacteriaceae bacterium]|nr:DUF4145 domain-containing protein [Ignavibacteriaceae bacterium]
MAITWHNLQKISSKSYQCGYCNKQIGSDSGYSGHQGPSLVGIIVICSYCNKPSFFFGETQTPAFRLGNEVKNIADESVKNLYNEARDCTSVGAYTSAILVCRKIIMHLAVEKGAAPGQSFVSYIDFLESGHYFPPNGRPWVDKIRQKGNEANHEIIIVNKDEAKELLLFVEFLLRFIYEFPSYTIPT